LILYAVSSTKRMQRAAVRSDEHEGEAADGTAAVRKIADEYQSGSRTLTFWQRQGAEKPKCPVVAP